MLGKTTNSHGDCVYRRVCALAHDFWESAVTIATTDCEPNARASWSPSCTTAAPRVPAVPDEGESHPSEVGSFLTCFVAGDMKS